MNTFIESIMLELIPIIYNRAIQENWEKDSIAGDQWVEAVSVEAFKHAIRTSNMRDAVAAKKR